MTSNDEILAPEQVAEMLGVKPRTLYAYRSQGKGPRSFLHAGKLRYRREDVIRYQEWQETSTAKGQEL